MSSGWMPHGIILLEHHLIRQHSIASLLARAVRWLAVYVAGVLYSARDSTWATPCGLRDHWLPGLSQHWYSSLATCTASQRTCSQPTVVHAHIHMIMWKWTCWAHGIWQMSCGQPQRARALGMASTSSPCGHDLLGNYVVHQGIPTGSTGLGQRGCLAMLTRATSLLDPGAAGHVCIGGPTATYPVAMTPGYVHTQVFIALGM